MKPRTHRDTQEFIVRNLTRAETLRYLDELRRRLLTGEALLRASKSRAGIAEPDPGSR
jgi:hypothetical protein